MAIQIEVNYSKKLGLPGYSSHQYSVTIRTELADLTQLSEESQKIHALLQSSVDREIQKTGYLSAAQPEPSQVNAAPHQNGNFNRYQPHSPRQHQLGYRNGRGTGNGNNGYSNNPNYDQWRCSPKQQELILKITA